MINPSTQEITDQIDALIERAKVLKSSSAKLSEVIKEGKSGTDIL